MISADYSDSFHPHTIGISGMILSKDRCADITRHQVNTENKSCHSFMASGGLYILIPKIIHRVNLILVWQIVRYRPGKAGIFNIRLC